MAPPTLHVHYRRTGSDQAPSCPVNYDEATDRLQIDCGALSPDLADLEARHQGDRYLLKNPHLTIPVSVSDDAERFVVLEPSEAPAQFHPHVFSSEGEAQAYFEDQRRPEVTRPGGYGPGDRLGTLLDAEIGGHGSVGEETAPFPQSSTREILTEGETNAFKGAGVTWALRLRAPRKTWLKWLSPLAVSLQGAWTKGTVGEDYTGHAGEEGNWKTWHAGLALGVQLDAQFVAATISDELLSWNLYARYETPLVAARHFEAFAALNGRSLAEDFGFDDILIPGDQHRADVGFTYCVSDHVCLGLGLFFRQYTIDHGEVHYTDMDFGGIATANFLSPRGRGAQRPDEVGNTHVAMNPLPMLRKAAPKVVVKEVPPARKAPPERKVKIPAKKELDFSGGVAFEEKGASLTTERSKIVQRCLKQKSPKECKTGVELCEEAAGKIGKWFRGIVDEEGFPENQQVGGSFEGHTNTNGPENKAKRQALNYALSNRRAASVEKCVVGTMATGNATAEKAGTPFPFPPNFKPVHKGYGETQLIIGRDGRADKVASRRVVIRISSDLAELQKVAPDLEPTPEIRSADQSVAAQIVKMAKPKGPVTKAFHHGPSNTIYAVVPVTYPSPAEALGKKKTFFNAVQRTINGQIRNLRKLSPAASFEILLQPTPPSDNNIVSNERINEAKGLLQKFTADSFVRDIHEIPNGMTPEQYANQLMMQGSTEVTPDETKWKALTDPKNVQKITVAGQAVAVYTIVPTFEKHLPDQVTRILLQAFAQKIVGKEKAAYARLYYGTSAKEFDAKKSMVVIGHSLQDPLKNRIGNVRHVPVADDPNLPPRLLLVVAPAAITDLEALRNVLFDQFIAPHKK